jgi:hypothetical protein
MKSRLISPLLSLLICFWCVNCSQAVTLGETYDSSGWQDIRDVTPPFLANWVKHGEFLLKTGEIHFDLKFEEDFRRAGIENAGKFDINENGVLIEKNTGKRPEFFYGLPFPEIDTKDPKAGAKIMSNFEFGLRRFGGMERMYHFQLIGVQGVEQDFVGLTSVLHYLGRPGGPIENTDNFSRQGMGVNLAPMTEKGTLSANWRYNDDRPDTCFVYVTGMRRVKRTSTASHSDPSRGSETCPDDNELWSGKNETFSWRFLEEKTVLCGFSSAEKEIIGERPDGSISRKFPLSRFGYDVSQWSGAPWAPLDITWSPRPVWIVEGVPKDPLYNGGKQLLYVDRETYSIWFKEVYTKSGTYWKGYFETHSFQVTPTGKTTLDIPLQYCAVDDQKHHATLFRFIEARSGYTDSLYLPVSSLGPMDFSLTAIQGMSK